MYGDKNINFSVKAEVSYSVDSRNMSSASQQSKVVFAINFNLVDCSPL